MALPKERYHAEDYWNLPDGERAELIDGQFYDMAPPKRIHQKLVSELTQEIGAYLKQNGCGCEIYPAPFAVNLDAREQNWVEPDLSVICDPEKLTDRGCKGAPDLIIEIVSPGSIKMDYIRKTALYAEAGVREYWIADPEQRRVMVYYFEAEDSVPAIYPFDKMVPSGIFPELQINFSELI